MKLDVVLVVPGIPFDSENFDKLSIGGAESAGKYMAHALAALGHRVTVFTNTDKTLRTPADGVYYLPLGMFQQYVTYTPHDVLVIQRAPELFAPPNLARFSALWCHDMPLGRSSDKVRGTAWNYDKLFVLSRYMRDKYAEVYGMGDELLFQTRNGVDLTAVNAARAELASKEQLTRDPYQLVFSARPERGADVLLAEIMPRVLEREPRAHLMLTTYFNPVDHLKDFYGHCGRLAQRLGDRVRFLGHLTKHQLYQLYLQSGLYVYPVPAVYAPDFAEISCLVGDSPVDMPRDYLKYPYGVPIKELVGKSGFPVYCYDEENQQFTLGTVKCVAKTRKNAEVWKLMLDDGFCIRATPDHKIMRRDGTWCELRDLKSGDSLMPLYKHVHISANLQNGWGSESRLVGEWLAGRSLNGHEEHVHHIGSYWDTGPENFKVLSRSEHFSITHKGKRRNGVERNRQSRSLKKLFAGMSSEQREQYFSTRPAAALAMWEKQRRLPLKEYEAWLKWRSNRRDMSYTQTSEWREKQRRASPQRIATERARFAALPLEEQQKRREHLSQMRSEANRRTWQDPAVRDRRISKMQQTKSTEESRQRRRNLTRLQWQNPTIRERMVAGLQANNHKVVSVGPDGFEDVYDMEIEKHHNFVVGGIVVHNCISLMETQACGLPVVASHHGALPETLGPLAGVLINKPIHTAEFYDEFAAQVVRLIVDRAAWGIHAAQGLVHAQTLDWRGVAEQWSELFEREIRARSARPSTMANHFWRRSDVYAAREVIRRAEAAGTTLPDIERAGLTFTKAQIEKHWAFIDEPDGFRRQYERIGGTHDPNVRDWAPQESRYAVFRDWLRKYEGEVNTVLDYGCAHGAYATNLLKELPHLRITGVDIDSHGVEMAYGFAEQLGVKDRWRGVVGDYTRLTDPDVPEMCEQYDCAVAQEVLEHVADPGAVLRALEARVKDGGYVYISVPFGPWEYADYRRYPHRAHVWEFDQHDLDDLLGAKGEEAQVTIHAMRFDRSEVVGDPLGWWLVTYKVTPATRGKLGIVNLDRKLWCQAPRQTVSANIIAGGPSAEETLLWAINSLEHVADQLVVVDCGLTPCARRLLADSVFATEGRLDVVPGVDPKRHGFETPRNLGLTECWGDWVLWIDTDERLLDPDKLHKYLRANSFNGYSIQQHHFAVDTKFDADLPVRLFRNPALTGTGMRWYGCVAGETLIDTPGGRVEISKLVGTQPWVYGYDLEKDQLTLARVKEVALVHEQAPVLRIGLDDGSHIRVTRNHPFLLRAGKYRTAENLVVGDRLMPLHRKEDGEGYFHIRVSGQYVREQRFVAQQVFGELPGDKVVHHKDRNRKNNDPDNLEIMDPRLHISRHSKGNTFKRGKKLSAETRQRIVDNHARCDGKFNSMWGRTHSAETLALIGQKSRDRKAGFGNSTKSWITSAQVRRMNADPAFQAKRLAGLRAHYEKLRAAALPDNHRIVDIREDGLADVFNLEVPGIHNYVAGGVVIKNCVHEHPEEGLNKGPGRTIVLKDVHIAHMGYLIESGRKARFARNLPMLNADIARYPDRMLQKHFIMRDNMLLCSYELQQNGGVVTDGIRARAQQTIDLWRKHFKGQHHLSNIDPISYYSQACALLGAGFDMFLQVAADKVDAKPNGGLKVRFFDMDDAMAEVQWRTRAAVEPYVNPLY